MSDEYICICRSVRRNNGIKQALLVCDDTVSQPEDIMFNVKSDRFVMGRRYLVQVIDLVGERG